MMPHKLGWICSSDCVVLLGRSGLTILNNMSAFLNGFKSFTVTAHLGSVVF